MNDKPITTITVDGRSIDVYTLQHYTTPYYFVPQFFVPGCSRKAGGPANNYQTIRQLTNYVRRQLKAGAA